MEKEELSCKCVGRVNWQCAHEYPDFLRLVQLASMASIALRSWFLCGKKARISDLGGSSFYTAWLNSLYTRSLSLVCVLSVIIPKTFTK